MIKIIEALHGYCNTDAVTWKNGLFGRIQMTRKEFVFWEFVHDAEGGFGYKSKAKMDNPDVILSNPFIYYCIDVLSKHQAPKYEVFFEDDRSKYVQAHESEPDAWKRNLADEWWQEHYTYMKQEPEPPLYDFICDEEVELLRTYKKNYVEYLESLIRKKDIGCINTHEEEQVAIPSSVSNLFRGKAMAKRFLERCITEGASEKRVKELIEYPEYNIDKGVTRYRKDLIDWLNGYGLSLNYGSFRK